MRLLAAVNAGARSRLVGGQNANEPVIPWRSNMSSISSGRARLPSMSSRRGVVMRVEDDGVPRQLRTDAVGDLVEEQLRAFENLHGSSLGGAAGFRAPGAGWRGIAARRRYPPRQAGDLRDAGTDDAMAIRRDGNSLASRDGGRDPVGRERAIGTPATGRGVRSRRGEKTSRETSRSSSASAARDASESELCSRPASATA